MQYLLVALTAGPMTEYRGLDVTTPGTVLSASATHYCNYAVEYTVPLIAAGTATNVRDDDVQTVTPPQFPYVFL